MKYYFNFLFFLLLTTFCAITSFATTLTDIDNILVLKSERLMMLKSGDKIIKYIATNYPEYFDENGKSMIVGLFNSEILEQYNN